MRLPLHFAILMFSIHLLKYSEGLSLHVLGIQPLKWEGLLGILTSPFVHGSFEHLYSNLLPLLALGTALHYAYPSVANRVWFFGWIFTGFWVWLAARPSVHIGASGIVYMLFAFLFVGGLLSRRRVLMGICLLTAFLYGGMVWGIFPIEEGVSWEAHMFGLMAGASLAVYYREVDFGRKKAPWELVGEEEYLKEAEERFGPNYWLPKDQTLSQNDPVEIIYHYRTEKKNPLEDEPRED